MVTYFGLEDLHALTTQDQKNREKNLQTSPLIRRESLGNSISQELEPILIFGPNDKQREDLSCFKNKTLFGSRNGIAVWGVLQDPPRTCLLSTLEALNLITELSSTEVFNYSATRFCSHH